MRPSYVGFGVLLAGMFTMAPPAWAGRPAPQRPSPHPAAPRCTPTGPGLADTAGVPAPGEYQLVVVPTTRPSRVGPVVTGRLWLWPAAPGDSSPRTGERAVARGQGDLAFTGATDAPLARAGVELRRDDPRLFPPLTSRDPVYPGLVAARPHGPFDRTTLWVGAANLRAPLDRMVRDGPGAIFTVERGDGRGGFVGTWGPAGRVGRAGHFCARYVGPAPAR